MSRPQSEPRFLLIGNPENRRVRGFVNALRQACLPEPVVLAHRELIRDPQRLYDYRKQRLIVRIDSAGENPEVERLLLAQGHTAAVNAGVRAVSPAQIDADPPRHGELYHPRQYQLGFENYLAALERVFSHMPHWRVLNPPSTIRMLFDKRLTSRLYQCSGIPVPDPLTLPSSRPGALRQAMRQRDWRSVYVKLSCGSSASGLAVYAYRSGRDEKLMTTMVLDEGRIFNSLKMQTVTQRQRIDRLLSFLLAEGAQIERAIAKARLQHAFMDCRVLMIDREPAFVVVRQSRHPVTNLHLGGWRGELSELRRCVGAESWRQAMASCRRVAGLHDSFQLGIDLMFEPRFRRHRVIESNAFGDLLPRLRRDGRSVYAYQIDRICRSMAPAVFQAD